jgi:hypothetical protein
MATLRQSEIDEILNNDRTMNRRVLDRTIAQVQSFNDERSTPNVQDIRLEAVIGNLVDKLKSSIAEALKLVALKQFPQVTGSNSSIILTLPAGQTGMTANLPNQEAQEDRDDDADAVPDAVGVDGRGKSFETAILKAQKKNKSENVDENQGYRYTSSLPVSYNKRISDDLEWLEPIETNEDGVDLDGGYCGGVGFGLRRRKRRQLKGAGPEDETPAVKKPTMKNQTQKISIQQNTQTVENVFYNIINQYNAIVDKILEATRNGGVLKNKRLASASISSYFANIVQGLIEPLKHLLYELALVRDKDTASMWTMMKSLVDNIQSAPPFQKVDFRIFKTPITDYQRLNRDIRIDDYSGKLAMMKQQKEKLEKSLKDLHKDASHIEYAMTDKSPEFKKQVKAHLLQKQKDLVEAIKQSDADAKYVADRQKSGLPYDSKALKDTAQDIQVREKILPVVTGMMTIQGAATESDEVLTRLMDGYAKGIKSMQEQIQGLHDKSKSEVLTEGDIGLLKSCGVAVETLKKNIEGIKKTLGVRRRSKEVERRFASQVEYQSKVLLALDALLGTTFEEVRKTKEQIAKEVEAEEAGAEGEEGDEGDEGAPAGNAGAAGVGLNGVGKPIEGYGRPLADLLARRKTQYNSMGRAIPDDDKIHRQDVKQNVKWQSSNPIHTTPVGSKNPFYAQQPDAKYDFRTMLNNENSKIYPKKNALGADVSLLQGAIGGPTEEAKQKRQYKKAEVETRTEADALRNILNQNVYEGGSKKQSGALRKLVFDDDDNDLFDGEELPVNKGFIKEDKDDKFKLPDVKKEQAKKKKQSRL